MKIYRKEKGIPEPEEKPEDIPARNDFSSAPQPEENRRNENGSGIPEPEGDFWKQDEGLDLDNGGSGRNESDWNRNSRNENDWNGNSRNDGGQDGSGRNGNGPDGGGSDRPQGPVGRFSNVPFSPSDQN